MTTGSLSVSHGSISSISSFMLDSRAPPHQGGYHAEEREREEAVEAEIQRLQHEIRLWRPANSARWIAWGFVQAKVPGMDEVPKPRGNDASAEGTVSEYRPDVSQVRSADDVDRQTDKSDANLLKHSGLDTDPIRPENAPLAHAAQDKRPEENPIYVGPSMMARSADNETEEDEEEGFDNLGYARDRALLFWGDMLQLGLVSREDLPAELLKNVKTVEY